MALGTCQYWRERILRPNGHCVVTTNLVGLFWLQAGCHIPAIFILYSAISPNLTCDIISRVHIISRQSTVPPLRSSLIKTKSSFTEKKTWKICFTVLCYFIVVLVFSSYVTTLKSLFNNLHVHILFFLVFFSYLHGLIRDCTFIYFQKKSTYRKDASSRPVYYSILEPFGQRSQYISIKFTLHKPSENPFKCYCSRLYGK